jgi:tetratricopeptide (TPR) repeat protein
MSKKLEILGRAVAVNTAGLLWQWIDTVIKDKSDYEGINEILDLVSVASFDIAEERAAKYLLERPNCAVGRMAATALCLEKSDLKGAIENLQTIYRKQPNNTIALYALGHCYERLGKEAEAIEFYQDCLKFKNYLELPRLRLAAIYFKNGQIEKAIQEYRKQISEYPDDIETLVLLGHLYMEMGNHDAAVEAFNGAILIHPDNFNSSPAEEEKIQELMEQESPYEAVDYLNELLEKQPEAADLHVQLADIFVQNEDFAQAVVHYEKAIRFEPNCLAAYVKLGSLYVIHSNLSLAAELFNKAGAINDEIVDAYFGLATAQKKLGDETSAMATLSLAGAIVQNSCVLFAEAARLRLSAANGTEIDKQTAGRIVLETFERAYHENQENLSVGYALGTILMKYRQFKQAGAKFADVFQRNETNYRALTRLVICMAEQDNKTAAMKYLDTQDASNKPGSQLIELHYKTALLYCNRAAFLHALETSRKEYLKDFDTASTFTTLNETLQNMGLIDRAYACWNLLGDMVNAVGHLPD